jgi:hypothetical protein
MVEGRKSRKLGVIGCGWVTESMHSPALSCLPKSHVIALADIDPYWLHQVADRFGITQGHTDYLALLDIPAIEAIAVCVPAQFHAEVGVAGLKAGKCLFIEKPLALSLDDGARLMRLGTSVFSERTSANNEIEIYGRVGCACRAFASMAWSTFLEHTSQASCRCDCARWLIS